MSDTITWTILSLLKWTEGYFAKHAIPNPRVDAEWLLSDLLHIPRIQLYARFDQPLSPTELTAFKERVKRRIQREPLQYILGYEDFFGLRFDVAPGVLIPRPETESLVEWALVLAQKCPPALRILDIGTGSGCIAITLAKRKPDSHVEATDLSPEAIAIATANANRHQAAVTFHHADLWPAHTEKFDLIISNPPYIPTADIATLQAEISHFEPTSALDGGKDGLDFYRRIVAESEKRLNPHGYLILEVGNGEAQDVSHLIEATQRFAWHEIRRDLNGVERMIAAQQR